jgi:hypothetical protein
VLRGGLPLVDSTARIIIDSIGPLRCADERATIARRAGT